MNKSFRFTLGAIFFIALTIALVVTSCAPTDSSESIPSNSTNLPELTQLNTTRGQQPSPLYRYVDREYNIVCYTKWGGDAGVFCLSLDE